MATSPENKMLNVVMLTNALAPDKLGGLERYVRELSAHLVRRGVGVTAVTKATDPEQLADEVGVDGVRVIRYRPPAKSDPLFGLKYPFSISAGVTRALAVAQPRGIESVIHGHFPVPMVPILPKKRFIYTFHAPVYKELRYERQGSYALPGPMEGMAVAGLKRLEKAVVRKASRIITLSDFVRDEVAALDAKSAERVTRIPGGVDLDRFVPAENAPLPRTITGNGPVIFAARRMVHRTGVEQLVEGFAKIASKHRGAMLVLAGTGTRRSNVEAMVRESGLQERVTMLGYVTDEELVRWYQSVDIAVTPTQDLEGFGLSTAEAMACGAVPLVTPVGANEEVVESLPRALVTKDASSEAIARGLDELITNEALRLELRGKVVVESAKRFGWENVVDQYMDLYRTQRA